jgi:hypothetical protein
MTTTTPGNCSNCGQRYDPARCSLAGALLGPCCFHCKHPPKGERVVLYGGTNSGTRLEVEPGAPVVVCPTRFHGRSWLAEASAPLAWLPEPANTPTAVESDEEHYARTDHVLGVGLPVRVYRLEGRYLGGRRVNGREVR